MPDASANLTDKLTNVAVTAIVTKRCFVFTRHWQIADGIFDRNGRAQIGVCGFIEAKH
jgi:hypothetical protein